MASGERSSIQYVVPPEQGLGAVSSPSGAALIFVYNPTQNTVGVNQGPGLGFHSQAAFNHGPG